MAKHLSTSWETMFEEFICGVFEDAKANVPSNCEWRYPASPFTECNLTAAAL